MAKITFTVSGELREGLNATYTEVRAAMETTMRQFIKEGQPLGQQHIRAAGFGPSWWKSFRGKFYDDTPAAFFALPIPFAGVYEEPTTIEGKPLMWVPTKNLDSPYIFGRQRLTPKRFRQAIGPLKRVDGKRPLLMAPILTAPSAMKGPVPKFGLGQLKRAAQRKGRVKGVKRFPLFKRMVPVFVGVDKFTTKKRLDLKGVFRALAAKTESYIYKNLKVD